MEAFDVKVEEARDPRLMLQVYSLNPDRDLLASMVWLSCLE